MSKAIQGAAMLAGAVGMGVAAFFDPALIASALFDKVWASLALGGISMEAGAIAQALTSNRGTNITIRQPAAYRQIVYGERRVGGVLIYTSTTGSHHDQYNAVIVLAGHEIDSITGVYLDGRKVYFQGSGAGWSVRNGVGFGGIADGGDHVGPGGALYNFGGTGHSGLYFEARYGDQAVGDVIGGRTANDPHWAADGLGNSPYGGGCAYVYMKLEYNPDVFPGGPAQAEVKFTVRGKNNILDPRTGTRSYTNNWALIVGDVLTDTQFGLGDLDSVNTDQLIAAANVCDEQVDIAIGGTESRYCAHWNYDTSVSPGDALANLMSAAGGRLSRVGGEWFIWPAYWQGPSFDFDDSALTGDLVWNPYRSLRELCNRVNGTYIAPNYPWNSAGNLYDSNGWYDGTLPNTFPFGYQPTSFPQYAQDTNHGYANDALLEADSGVLGEYDSTVTYALNDAVTLTGVIYRSLTDANLNNDPSIHSVPGGSAAVWASGTTYAAGAVVAYQGPAWASGTTYAAGAVVLYGSRSYLSLVSSNTGHQPDISPADWVVTVQAYVSLVGSNTGHQPDTSPTDWAAVAWVRWNNQLPMELDLNCVLSVAQAQRLAKIALLRNRQQGSGTLPLHLAAWEMPPLSVFNLDAPTQGLSSKVLEVVSTRFFFEEQNGVMAIKFEAAVQETSQSIYEWNPATEELTVYGVPSNPASMPITIDAPTGLTLSSSAATAVVGSDGITTPRILATWTAPTDVRVAQMQIQHSLHGAATWVDDGTVDVATTTKYISGVVSGSAYDVRIRSLTNMGATSAWEEVDNITVAAPNSLQSTYSNNPQFALTQPTSTTIAVAAVAVTFGNATVNYAARTKTISAPSVATPLYVTIADATQQGESGSPTLVVTVSTSNSLVGVIGNTYIGSILALPAGGATRIGLGGWPVPASFQVVA